MPSNEVYMTMVAHCSMFQLWDITISIDNVIHAHLKRYSNSGLSLKITPFDNCSLDFTPYEKIVISKESLTILYVLREATLLGEL